MRLVEPLARARGHGSAKAGTGHWWAQRVTAVALAPLTIWLVVVLLDLRGAAYGEVTAWLAQPLNAALVIAWVVSLLHHAQLGLQVVVEDYVHVRWQEYTLLIGIKLAAALGGIVAAIAVLRVVFGD